MIYLIIYLVGCLSAFFLVKGFIRSVNNGAYGKKELRDTIFLSLLSVCTILIISYFYITEIIDMKYEEEEKEEVKKWEIDKDIITDRKQ